MPKQNKQYSYDEIVKWSEEYKKTYSFYNTGKIFGVDYKIVRQLLIENKSSLNLQTKQDLIDAGLRKCSLCSKIKPNCDFGSYKQKSRCKECSKEMSKKYREDNLEKCLTAERKWYNTNKKYKSQYRKKYVELKKDDPVFKLKKRLRNRIRDAIKNNKKPGSSIKCLGCTLQELKEYMEKLFYDNPGNGEKMTWENYSHSGWHIDHKIPLVSFDLTDLKQFEKACHYTNLQPLWSSDHKKKTVLDLKKFRNKKP